VFVSDRVSYIVLRGRWCNTTALNMYISSEEKSGYSNDSLYKELGQILFIIFHTKILLRYFNAKWGRQNVFKLTIGNESLHQDSNDYGVRIVTFYT
jgi:hypothetical protein